MLKLASKSKLLILISFLFLASACSSKDPNEPKEILPPGDEVLNSDAPEEVLLKTAQELYSSGLFTVARDSFSSLQATYPLGAYREYAQIKVADCSFLAREYEASAAQYEAFLKDHPTHSSRPYVTFKLGLSHYLHNKGVGRDIAPLEQALTYFQKTQNEFPDTSYAKTAKRYQQLTEKKLAQHNKAVLAFYKSRGLETAYTDRKSEYNSKWANYLNQKVTNTNNSLAMLSPELLAKANSLTTLPKSETTYSKSIMQINSNSGTIIERTQGQARLQSVKCTSGETPSITLYFNESSASDTALDQFSANNSELTPNDGTIQFSLSNLDAELRSHNCWGDHDLSISAPNNINLRTFSTLEVMRLNNPNRLLLIVK